MLTSILRRLPNQATLALGLISVALATIPATAAPTITNVSLRGLQAGSTNTLVIEGTELLPEPHLLLDVAVEQKQLKDGATPQRLEFEINLSPTAAVGIHHLRIASASGISNPVPIAVDSLQQAPFGPDVAQLPVALTGVVRGAEVLKTSFTGRQGETFTVDVEARRIASVLNPAIHLYDDRQVQVAWAQPLPGLGGDARLTVKLPKDGRYTVELHDALYNAAAPSFFRLKLGNLQFASAAIPLAAKRGTTSGLELLGSEQLHGAKVELEIQSGASDSPAPLPALPGITGPSPRVIASDLDEISEARSGADPQSIAAPTGVSGLLSAAGEEDTYSIAVQPGQQLNFAVQANSLGSPLDGVLLVRNAAGQQLAMSDDRPGTSDPGLDFTVPEGVDSIVVALKDLTGRGGPDYFYRIAVTPVGTPSFQLSLTADRYQIPQGSSVLMQVNVARSGYGGPIRLELPGLPAGITVSNNELPAGVTQALVSLSAQPGVRSHGVIRVVGAAADPNVAVARTAVAANAPYLTQQPWLATEVGIAVTPPSPLTVAWADATAPTSLPLGGKLPVTVSIARAAEVQGPVRLSLVTSQIPPKKNNEQNQPVDDVENTLRLEAPVTIAADQTTGAVTLLVPASLNLTAYDVALKAELLSADGTTVVATATTPVQRLAAAPPQP